jgi:5-(carboxyamino)imidazole ribonucleotide synthase
MLVIAARRMGYRVHTLSPEHDTPTGQVSDRAIRASYEDLEQVRSFARGVDVVTFEFESVPAAAVQAASEHVAVRPNRRVLEIAQHRIREKSFLAEHGFPVTPFVAVRTEADLLEALHRLGRPVVLKTATCGYDGKGQVRLSADVNGTDTSDADAKDAWAAIGRQESVLEAFVELDRELSVIGARGVDGSWSHFDPIENVHCDHILDVSTAPIDLPRDVVETAVGITCEVMEALDHVGVLCIEFFLTRGGRLLINEIAPRPHNSGHLTFDACRTSQFEQQARAICGVPLGSPEMLQPAAMANLLGDLWANGEPNWAAALASPNVKLHLYGKTKPRIGRKMGHLTALARTAVEARELVLSARSVLTRR